LFAGEHGLKFPVCQLNIDIELPTRIGEARRMVRWFKRLSTETKALHKQYIVGYSTIVMNGSSMRLRFYAINVGQPKCVAKFLDQSECRALIGSIYDE
jgi:hypothetical protein